MGGGPPCQVDCPAGHGCVAVVSRFVALPLSASGPSLCLAVLQCACYQLLLLCVVHLFVVYGFPPEVHLEKLALTSQLLAGVPYEAKVVASGQLEVVMGDPDVPLSLLPVLTRHLHRRFFGWTWKAPFLLELDVRSGVTCKMRLQGTLLVSAVGRISGIVFGCWWWSGPHHCGLWLPRV